MRTHRKLKVALLILGSSLVLDRPSNAYNGGTHHSIVALGWEVMRSGADPQFGNHIDWQPVAPATVGVPPTPLSQVGTCDFCGPGATQQAWTDFLATIQPSMIRLNTLDPGLSFIPCTGRLTSDNTIKGMLVAFGHDPSQIESPKACADLGRRLQGGAYDGQWHPGGIFDYTNPNPAIDGNGYQGPFLGWEAKTGDDHIDDTVFESIWLAFGTTVAIIIGVLVIAGILIAGGAAFLAGAVAVIVVLALLFCLAGILDGDGCGDGVINGFTHLIEAAHEPATALDNLVPELDGILPRGGDISSSSYTGMWHFIHARSGGSNSYDDREGLYYDEAGPEFPGQFDVLLQAGLDLGDLHLGFDESSGPHRYEIRGANDGHPDSERRSFARWQGPTGAHLQFSPLDNFAFYGWSNFLASKNAHWLSWPLHALGDATVPMHVTGTSSWGHRPYEDELDWGEDWNVIRFLGCTPESLGSCAQKCFMDATDPTKKCPEATGAIDNSRQQFEQARRILQHAFRWSRFIAAWRARMGRPNDVAVRDMVTELASQTLTISNPSAGDNVWPWCDDCSMQWAIYKTDHQGMNFYKTADSLNRSRDLIERASGAVIAFLLATADALPAPAACSNTTCSTATTCCGTQTCVAGTCCTPAQGACEHDSDCCGTASNPSVCRNSTCVIAAAATCQQPGNSCDDGPIACCEDSAAAKQCAPSQNGVFICCNGNGATCKSSVECCSGSCRIEAGDTGTCDGLPPGSGCTGSAQCQDGAACDRDGSPVGFGAQGTCCNPTTTGTLDCTDDRDCCSGHCTEVADDVFKCRCVDAGDTCARDNDCCGGSSCVGGTCQATCRAPGATCQGNSQCCGDTVCCLALGATCASFCPPPGCHPAGSACNQNVDCCSHLCGPDQRCECLGTNSSCGGDSECCTGNCDPNDPGGGGGSGGSGDGSGSQSTCGACLAPQIACGAQCCPGGTLCCGITTDGTPICASDCRPPPT